MALTISAAVGGSLYGAWRYMTGSERFAVRDIQIQPGRHATADDLAARLPFAVGDNLFRIDLAAGARALEQHPWIARASLRRRPPGTILVEVREREATAAVHLGALYLCDGAGVVFKRATLNEADGLLVVTGVGRDEYLSDPVASQARIREVLLAARAWVAGDRPALSEAAVHPDFGVTLFLREGAVEVRLGRGDLAPKLERYDVIARELERRGERARAIVLDSVLRPDRVAVRLVPAAEGG